MRTQAIYPCFIGATLLCNKTGLSQLKRVHVYKEYTKDSLRILPHSAQTYFLKKKVLSTDSFPDCVRRTYKDSMMHCNRATLELEFCAKIAIC